MAITIKDLSVTLNMLSLATHPIFKKLQATKDSKKDIRKNSC